MTVTKDNSEQIRQDLKTLYEISSNELLDKYLRAILNLISAALRSRPGYAQVNFRRLYKATVPFVFGQPQPHQIGFTDKPAKEDSFNIGIGRKIVRLLLGDKSLPGKDKEDKALRSFIDDLNEAMAKRCGRSTFDIEDLLNHNTAEDLQRAFKAFKKKHKKKPKDAAKQLTHRELVKQALVIIAQSNEAQPDYLREVHGKSVYLVGKTKEIRGLISDLTDLSDQQISGALHQLENDRGIVRLGNRLNKEIYLPTADVPEVTQSLESSSEGNTEKEKEVVSRSSHLTLEEKCERFVQALREIFEASDRTSPRSHTEEVDGEEVSYIYIGRQDKILDNLEELSGLSGSQRRAATNHLKENNILSFLGSTLGGRAKYYLQEGYLELPEADEEPEDSSLQESVINGNNILDNLDTLLQPENLPKLRKTATDLQQSIELFEKGGVDALDKEINALEAKLGNLRKKREKIANLGSKDVLKNKLEIIEFAINKLK